MILKSEDGMTLIDIALAMIVIGLLTVPLLRQYDLYQTQMAQTKTTAYLDSVQAAVQRFARIHQRLPCPADPRLIMGDVGYGEERVDAGPPRTCVGGYVGAVPFQTLQISENLTFDMYGNKLTYAVSSNNIDGATKYHEMVGNLTRRYKRVTLDSGCSQSESYETDLINPLLFVVLSHGPNGDGAYGRNSRVADACDGNGLGNTVELENCNGDTTFLAPVTELVNNCPSATGMQAPSMLSEARSTDYYDDLMLEEGGFDADMFLPSSDNTARVIYSEAARIGIGTDDPREAVEVGGDVYVDGAGVNANRICNENGSRCMRPEQLGGSSGMFCGSGGATDFRDNNIECDSRASGLPPTTCGTGQYVIGVAPNGNLICGAI